VVSITSWKTFAFFISSTIWVSAIHNHKVLLQSHQSPPCFLLLFFSLFQLLWNLMEFLIQLFLSKLDPCIIFLPFLLVGFKFQRINPMLNALLLI
jgi:hypothetical protein